MQPQRTPHDLPTNLTVEQFLAWYEQQTDRYELHNGSVVAMSPDRTSHNLVKGDVADSLRRAIVKANLNCHVFNDHIGIVINHDSGKYYEPDTAISCDTTIDGDSTTIENPCLVVEVLSPSTQTIDLVSKLEGYLSVDSVVHYLIVDPLLQTVVLHSKLDGAIQTTFAHDGTIELTSPALSIPAHEFFVSATRAGLYI